MSSTMAEAHKQFEEEKKAYWAQRDALLQEYTGRWVAIVNGQVAGAAAQMNKAAGEAFRNTGKGVMYVALVGNEDVVLRVRQAASGRYDEAYYPPMPVLSLMVSSLQAEHAIAVSFVVDTGADLSVLRDATADAVGLWNDPAGQVQVAGIGGQPQVRQMYNALVQVGSDRVLITADCRGDVDEDILGRDVINDYALTVCAKRGQVELAEVEEE